MWKFQQFSRNSGKGYFCLIWKTWTQTELENTWHTWLLKARQLQWEWARFRDESALLCKRSGIRVLQAGWVSPNSFQILACHKHSWCHSTHKLLMCWGMYLSSSDAEWQLVTCWLLKGQPWNVPQHFLKRPSLCVWVAKKAVITTSSSKMIC